MTFLNTVFTVYRRASLVPAPIMVAQISAGTEMRLVKIYRAPRRKRKNVQDRNTRNDYFYDFLYYHNKPIADTHAFGENCGKGRPSSRVAKRVQSRADKPEKGHGIKKEGLGKNESGGTRHYL